MRHAAVVVAVVTVAGSTLAYAGHQQPPAPSFAKAPHAAPDSRASVTVAPDDLVRTPAAADHDGNVPVSNRRPNVPAVTLAAYQNASRVVNSVAPSCHLRWTLLAAIGEIESDHGRTNGNEVRSDGTSAPGIYGPPLDGSNATVTVGDTDHGKYDRDTSHDRAVGPMQIIPSTWKAVAVDGDDDGHKNPQDVQDAAFGAAVYLCASEIDMSSRSGLRTAVFRYNHSTAYVDSVLARMGKYDGLTPALTDGTSTNGSDSVQVASGSSTIERKKSKTADAGNGSGAGRPTKDQPAEPGPTPSTSTPTPTPTPTQTPTPDPSPPPTTDPTEQPLTPEWATVYCSTELSEAQLEAVGGLDGCVELATTGGTAAVQAALVVTPATP
jgi:hypothetical protein